MEKKSWNVVFITLDGLRRDRLDLCPNLMKVSKENLFFSKVITAAPYTIASMHATFSSMYPSKNGVNSYYNMFKFKKDKIKTLHRYFKESGFYTSAQVLSDCIIPNDFLDRMDIQEVNAKQLGDHKQMLTEASKKGQFFTYFEYMGLHDGMVPLTKEYGDYDEGYFGDNVRTRNKKVYRDLVKECDNYVGEIISHLKKLKILNNTLLIFHSDHGTSEGDKEGEKMYGTYLYDYTLKTFCTFIIPNKIKKQIDFQCATIDIMPTILELIGIKKDSDFMKIQGKSLIPFVRGEEKRERLAFSETGGLYGPWPSRKEHNVFCVRANKKKIIYNKAPKTWEFYDLQKDPSEKNNLILEATTEIKEYKKLLLKKLIENKIKL